MLRKFILIPDRPPSRRYFPPLKYALLCWMEALYMRGAHTNKTPSKVKIEVVRDTD